MYTVTYNSKGLDFVIQNVSPILLLTRKYAMTTKNTKGFFIFYTWKSWATKYFTDSNQSKQFNFECVQQKIDMVRFEPHEKKA